MKESRHFYHRIYNIPTNPQKNKIGEQASASNGGQRPSLNSGFLSRRGWPIRSLQK
jgi:hypothetical protein